MNPEFEEALDTLKRIYDGELSIEFFESLGYSEVRQVNGMWCGLTRMIFTVGVCINLDAFGHDGRICFDTWDNASKFLKEWDGKTRPVVGEDGVMADKWVSHDR